MAGLFERLTAALAGKAVPVPMPAWCAPKLVEVEELVEVRRRDASSSWAGFIHYTDAGGVETSRRVVCRSIAGFGQPETFTAWCCERKANRTFRIDRVRELVDLETGEVLDPTGHFAALWRHGALKIADKTLNDFARVLVFMARCDGRIHPLEVESLETAIERYILRFGGDDRMYDSAVANAGKIAPDGEDFVTSLERMGRHPEADKLSRLVLESVSNVVLADGRYAAAEIEWVEVVTETLKAMAGPR